MALYQCKYVFSGKVYFEVEADSLEEAERRGWAAWVNSPICRNLDSSWSGDMSVTRLPSPEEPIQPSSRYARDQARHAARNGTIGPVQEAQEPTHRQVNPAKTHPLATSYLRDSPARLKHFAATMGLHLAVMIVAMISVAILEWCWTLLMAIVALFQ